jgi:YQGE family putative transporter
MNNNINDNRTKRLLTSNILFKSATLVSQIFLNIFLFKNTNDISLVALFNIILLSFQLLSFTFFARIVKFWYRNLTHVISLLWLSLIYLSLVLLWENIVNNYILLAMWIWFLEWMYRIGYNNNEFDLTNINNRWNFQWLKKSLKALTAIIIPSLIWTIIWLDYLWYGYWISFWIWAILFLLSAFIWIIKIEYTTDTKYCMKNAIKKIATNKDLVKIVSNFGFLWFSLSSPLIETILPLLLFSYWISEMNLWFLVSLFALVTVVFSYLFWKFVLYKNYKVTYIISWIFYIISVFILLFFPTYWYIIIFASILKLLSTFISIPQNVFSSNVFHDIKWYEEIKSEYMVIREWPLNIWVILSFTCIYFIWNFEILWIKILFWLMAIIMFVSTYLFSSIKIKHN